MRAVLIDCGVIVKEIPEMGEYQPNLRIMKPKELNVSMVEEGFEMEDIGELETVEFRYLFTEDNYRVYVRNMKALPYLMGHWSAKYPQGDPIKFSEDLKTRIENCLRVNVEWLGKIARGQEFSDGALDEALNVISRRIFNEISF